MDEFPMCQACGDTGPIDDGWWVQTIQFDDVQLELLVCEECAKLERGKMFEHYKARIREGKDPEYT